MVVTARNEEFPIDGRGFQFLLDRVRRWICTDGDNQMDSKINPPERIYKELDERLRGLANGGEERASDLLSLQLWFPLVPRWLAKDHRLGRMTPARSGEEMINTAMNSLQSMQVEGLVSLEEYRTLSSNAASAKAELIKIAESRKRKR
jgi:hypothetical protein